MKQLKKQNKSEDTLMEFTEKCYNLLDINEFVIDISSNELIIENKNEEKEIEIEKVKDEDLEINM